MTGNDLRNNILSTDIKPPNTLYNAAKSLCSTAFSSFYSNPHNTQTEPEANT